MKVFISWSGNKSREVAQALRDWLPYVINDIAPFVSSKDIEPGARWPSEIARRLEDTTYGIVCVTQDNQQAQWLNFEAGALAKAVEESRVVPLAIDLKPSDIEPPLGHFQAQEATEGGMRGIVHAINDACKAPLEKARLDTAFDKWWPDLDAKLTAIVEAEPAASSPRPERELLEEILDVVRGLSRTPYMLTNWPTPELDRMTFYEPPDLERTVNYDPEILRLAQQAARKLEASESSGLGESDAGAGDENGRQG